MKFARANGLKFFTNSDGSRITDVHSVPKIRSLRHAVHLVRREFHLEGVCSGQEHRRHDGEQLQPSHHG